MLQSLIACENYTPLEGHYYYKGGLFNPGVYSRHEESRGGCNFFGCPHEFTYDRLEDADQNDFFILPDTVEPGSQRPYAVSNKNLYCNGKKIRPFQSYKQIGSFYYTDTNVLMAGCNEAFRTDGSKFDLASLEAIPLSFPTMSGSGDWLKDKNGVYWSQNLIDFLDPHSIKLEIKEYFGFSQFGANSYNHLHITDDNGTYIQIRNGIYLLSSKILTSLGCGYMRSNNAVYWNGLKITNVDPQSFEVMTDAMANIHLVHGIQQ